MAIRAQLKLLLFLIVVGVAAGTIAVAVWAYQNILMHDEAIAQQIATPPSDGRPPPDPGAHHFVEAIDLIQGGKLDAGREGLYKLLRQFPRSPTTAEAKRIIGEMNLDNLYAMEASGGKRDYIVQPGDNLTAIAVKHGTTLDSIARVNGLTSLTGLQPGDHLFLIPMNFDLVVDASTKIVTLMREGRFFREYRAIELRTRPNMKIPAALEVATKSAINPVDGKAANPTSTAFLDAEKRIVLSYKNSPAAALMISIPTVAKAIPVSSATPPPLNTELPNAEATGLFLAPEDLEEIYPLLRKGSSVTIVQ
ncbi:MAG: LysM peptidoglycan-binding domain-containing protein [Verrucomicrobiaceae bacterium]|nr:LysM peptidoglycan-binding domain-containing protein [Verrucomicrobiaceae bacterium]